MKNSRMANKLIRSIVLLALLLLMITLSSFLSTYSSDFTISGDVVLSSFCINLFGRLSSSVFVVIFAWLLISFLYKFNRGTVVVTGFSILFISGILIFSIDSLKQEEAARAYLARANATESPIDDDYLIDTENALSFIKPINSAISFFLPTQQYSVDTFKSQNYFLFHIYHLAIYFFFSFLLLSFLGRRLLNRISATFVRYNHSNIFWGYSDAAMYLAKDIIKTSFKDEAIFILFKDSNYDPNKDNVIFDNINQNDAIALYVNDENLNPSKKIYQAYRHFFMTQDQDFNIKMALKFANKMKSKPRHISIYIFAQTESVSTLFESFRNTNIDINIYNYADLTARDFVYKYPILNHKEAFNSGKITIDKENCKLKGSFNTLLLGLGNEGFELLNKSLCNAQFGSDFNFNLTCIDSKYNLQHSQYKNIFNDAQDYGYSLEINPTYLGETVSKPNSQLFYDWLSDGNRILNYDRIIICLGDDELNIQTALKLVKYRMQYQSRDNQFENIFTHLENFSKYEYYNYIQSNMITIFGGVEAINTYDLIINEQLDHFAKLVNFIYSKSKDLTLEDFNIDEIEQHWQLCSLFEKDSSRGVAMNISNIISLASSLDDFSLALKDKSLLEHLSELEHLRWCAFLYMNNVRKWNYEDVNTSNGKQIFNNILVRHIAHRPYCEIGFDSQNSETENLFDPTKASGVINTNKRTQNPSITIDNLTNYKESTRRILRHFPLLLKLKNSRTLRP